MRWVCRILEVFERIEGGSVMVTVIIVSASGDIRRPAITKAYTVAADAPRSLSVQTVIADDEGSEKEKEPENWPAEE